LILGEQQYFVWDTAAQSTKFLDILKIWGAKGPCPPGYAYAHTFDTNAQARWCNATRQV